MKHLTLFILLLSSLSVAGQVKQKHVQALTDKVGLLTYNGPVTSYLNDGSSSYAWLFIGGRVDFTHKGSNYLIVVHDTSKLSIKYADSLFILHISKKFVTKINDSTYSFKNK